MANVAAPLRGASGTAHKAVATRFLAFSKCERLIALSREMRDRQSFSCRDAIAKSTCKTARITTCVFSIFQCNRLAFLINRVVHANSAQREKL
jgi:hypothetical protein